MKSLRQIASELKISPSYLSDILKGKKGCDEEAQELLNILNKGENNE